MPQADSSLSTNVLPFRRPKPADVAISQADVKALLLDACLKHMTKKSVGQVRQALFIYSDTASKARLPAKALAALQALDLLAEHR